MKLTWVNRNYNRQILPPLWLAVYVIVLRHLWLPSCSHNTHWHNTHWHNTHWTSVVMYCEVVTFIFCTVCLYPDRFIVIALISNEISDFHKCFSIAESIESHEVSTLDREYTDFFKMRSRKQNAARNPCKGRSTRHNCYSKCRSNCMKWLQSFSCCSLIKKPEWCLLMWWV